ncbi:hypothetical protein [Paraburkholderia sp. DHOC27]|uniref:hypothetical protein n=1 Tax=Paraburkholderia sp. DHOC27 TaxID=2303330 RepID=UPI000E9359BE|nr:hypothetical protein [Paraburkholderia sp. DHOC27]RFU48640.1 hypothetical protein D0B32_02035 [Paraburkholderia sp. DHOC27]
MAKPPPYDHRPTIPDPARDPELTVINAALTHAQDALKAAHRAIQALRMSDEAVAALEHLEQCQKLLRR